MVRARQSSFAAGEITPALHARVGAEEYRSGAALLENWFVSIYGGLLNRPGTRFVEEVTPRSRLIPFQLGENEGYACEFGANSLRFYTRGARLIVQGTNAVVNPAVGEAVGQWNNKSTGSASIELGAQIVLVPPSDGTPIGNMLEGGGLAAAFEGSSNQPAALGALINSHQGSLGKSWGGARTVNAFRLYGSNDLGLTGRQQTVTVVLYGSNSVFLVDVTELGRWQVADKPGVVVDRSLTGPEQNFTSHAVVINYTAVGDGQDRVAISELQFYERNSSVPSLRLRGSLGGISRAEQIITTSFVGREHVLRFLTTGQISIQAGHTSLSNSSLPQVDIQSGWATLQFTPQISPFYLQIFHFGGDVREVTGIEFHPAGFLSMGAPYLDDDMPAVRFTQDANCLTLTSERFREMELRRGPEPLTWLLSFKRFGPLVEAPRATALSITKFGAGAATTVHTYVVTYVSEDGGETLPSAPISIAGVSPLTTTDYIRINVVPLPLPTLVGCNIYKQLGGSYGLMGFFVSQFDDTGQVPKVDQAPPQDRNPFLTSPSACCTYWEQRLALAGSEEAPETVELSKPGAAHDFGRSSPPRDDDAITFTPAGPQARRVRHMLASADLAMFCDASVVIARRGESALTPALEGGVRQVLARGIGIVRPMLIDRNLAFVSSDGQSVRLLDPEYQEAELSLQSEHLFRGRFVTDWAYQEAPWSLLWLAMSDGKMVALSLLPRQGVIGWARATTDGLVESLCSVREAGIDRLYMRCRRWLRGAWRNTVELLGERQISDVRDAYFVDCGLSLDKPLPIVSVTLGNPGQLVASNHFLSAGDQLDIDGTGIADLDDRRFTVSAVSGTVITVAADWSGLGPYRGGGVLRKVFASVSGLGHLEGSAVMVLNTGNVEGPKTVSDGVIALETPGSRVHVGLPYQSLGSTLAIAESPEGYGSRKNVHEVQVLVRDTRALEFGKTFAQMDKIPARSTQRFGEPIGLDGEKIQEIPIGGAWGLGGKLCFRQALPLPAEILSISPAFERSTG